MIAQPASGASPAPAQPSPVQTVVVPDWGNQVSLLQTRQPAFWLYVVVLAICGILLATTQFEYLRYSPIAFVVGAVLLAIFAVPIFLLIGFLDLFEREPLSLMVGAFLWGAVAVFPLALATNNALIELWVKLFGAGLGIGWLAAIIPPPVEEILKFLGVCTVFLIARSEFDDVLDGFVYGALVGLGFQITEDMFYFFTHFIGPAQGANEIGALIEGYWIRVISSGLYSHPLYAGLGGMGLAYWATRLDQPLQRRRLFLFGGLGLGILLHVFWNAPFLNSLLGDNPGPINWVIFSAIKGIPLLIFVALLVRLATQRDQTYFAAVMGPAVGSDVVTADEMRGLSDLRNRFTTRRAMRARKGPVAGKLLARLQREQLRYAMIATQTVGDRSTLLAAQAELIRTLRAELTAMPDAPQVAVAMPTAAGVQPTTVATPAGWPAGAAPGAQPSGGWVGSAPAGSSPGTPAWQPAAGAGPAAGTAAAGTTGPWQPAAGASPAAGAALGTTGPAYQPAAAAGPAAGPGSPAGAAAGGSTGPWQPAAGASSAAAPATGQPTWQPSAASTAGVAPASSAATGSSAAGSASTTPSSPASTPGSAAPAEASSTSAATAEPAAATTAQPTGQPSGGGQPSSQAGWGQPASGGQGGWGQPEGQPSGGQSGPQPASGQPSSQSGGGQQPGGQPSSGGQPSGQPGWGQPSSGAQPSGQSGWSQQPGGGQASGQPGWAQPSGQQPSAGQSGWAQPQGQPAPGQPTGQQPGAGQPAWGQPQAQPTSGQPTWQQPGTGQPGSQPAQQGQSAWQQPGAGAQPQWRPATPAVPAGPAGWAPTHRAALNGQQSWDQPDPSRPMTPLAGGLELQVVQRIGDWARVVAVNGWSGWVDARLLVPRQ